VLMVSQSARRPVAVGPMVNASGSGSGHQDRAAGVPVETPAGGVQA
jgi:hypothetical protein